MDKFYVIKLIQPDRKRGYVIDSPKGILISTSGLHPDVTQFPTYSDAYHFIRENKLERKGVKAYIRDNNDLIEEEKSSITPATSNMFYLENDKGEKAFYDAKHEGYYFQNRDAGYCFWDDEEQLKLFLQDMQFPNNVKIKRLESSTPHIRTS